MKLIHSISLCKALTWRVLATVTTMIISYLVTGRVDLAIVIGGFEVITKIIIYYIHERFWNIILMKRKSYGSNPIETD